jgi:hypothetical protein
MRQSRLYFPSAMEKEIHNRKQRLAAKRWNLMESAIVTIKAVVERIDPYEGWQQVCGMFQSNVGLGLPELKQFLQIEGVNPNSTLSVTDELRDIIWRNAVQFLRIATPANAEKQLTQVDTVHRHVDPRLGPFPNRTR